MKTNSVKKGQFVLIPSSKNTTSAAKGKTNTPAMPPAQHFLAAKQYKMVHIVQNNESYPQLQQKYGVSGHDIQAWNHLDAKTPLRPGQQLIIWRRSSTTGTYIVKAGDSLSIIAQRNNTKTGRLMQLNPSLKGTSLRVGQKIVLG